MTDNVAPSNGHLIDRLPRYRCHKVVRAARIEEIATNGLPPGWAALVVEDLGEFLASPAFIGKHNPQVGMMLVAYDDGYQSISPAEAFEAGYTRL